MKKTYNNIPDLIFGHFKIESWENIPEPIAQLIDKPFCYNNYETFTRCEYSYNEFVRLYIKEFCHNQYQKDYDQYFLNCSQNKKKKVNNPFYYPQSVDGDNLFYCREKIDIHEYHFYFNQDYESFFKVYEILLTQTSLAQILSEFNPSNKNFIEYLHPMVYALLTDHKKLLDLQNPYKHTLYMNAPVVTDNNEEIPF